MNRVLFQLAFICFTTVAAFGWANSNSHDGTDAPGQGIQSSESTLGGTFYADDESSSEQAPDGDPSLAFKQNADGSVTAPDGLIWYPVIKKADGSILNMTYGQAMTCCNAGPRKAGYPDSCPFGAGGKYLPSIDEFKTLRDQLGYGSPLGYDASPVADLSGHWFWSSSPDDANNAWPFGGTIGDVGYDNRYDTVAVRCVGR